MYTSTTMTYIVLLYTYNTMYTKYHLDIEYLNGHLSILCTYDL